MREQISILRSMRVRDFVSQVLTVGLILSTIFVCWRVICIVPATEHPVVVVISGSMEPGYRRGDILLLHNLPQYPPVAGDIIVYMMPGRPVPIVHRIVRVHQRSSDGKRLFLTKGDNNKFDDSQLFPAGMDWIEEDMILGKSFAYIPYVGYFTVMFQESIVVKYAVIGLLGFFLLTAQS